jgi:hypothetical protein
MAEMNRETVYPPAQPEYSLSGEALRQEDIEAGGVGAAPSPADGMHRYPTEAPPRPERSWPPSLGWTTLGGVAGAIGAALWMRRRTRRSRPEGGAGRRRLDNEQ